MSERQRVVSISDRPGYQPDLGELARHQVASARQAIDATPEEFAALLAPLLGWDPTGPTVESWESKSTPPGDVLVAASMLSQEAGAGQRDAMDMVSRLVGDRYADLAAVYPTRTDFTAQHAPTELFDGAEQIDAAGVSLNLICQQYPEKHLRAVVESGARLRLLFIDPEGDAVKRYEREEGYADGQIAALTQLNIHAVTQRVRDQLPEQDRERVQLAVYDETTRFNLVLVDRERCVMQPYLPQTRGIDSPTFLIHRTSLTLGLFPTFEQVFSSLWERGTRL